MQVKLNNTTHIIGVNRTNGYKYKWRRINNKKSTYDFYFNSYRELVYYLITLLKLKIWKILKN